MNRPVTGVVGAGRVGAVLAAELRAAGYPIAAVSGSSDASRLRAATLLPGVDVVEPSEVARRARLVFLCVPDDALASVAAGLAAEVGPEHLVLHTSGRHGLEVLAPLAAAGARTGAFHPAMTFTGTDRDLGRSAVFGLTADQSDRRAIEGIVADLGGRARWIADADRPLYHAALVHGANHLVTLVTQAAALLRQAGIAETDQVLGPLLSAALDNALHLDTAALTGPVVRGDEATVRAHLDRLADAEDTIRDSYVAMARATTVAAESDGRLDRTSARALRRVLADADAEALAATVAGAR